MQKENSIAFELRQIETNQFATFGDGKSNPDQLTEQVQFSFGAILEEQIIACIFTYTLKMDEQPFLMIELTCSFYVAEKYWNKLLDLKKQELVLPKSFAQHVANITVGTARGVLHTKTERTLFNQYPVALINLEEIFTREAVITWVDDRK